MLFAIVSDSHDAIPNLRKAISLANRRGATYLLHCGDLISPFMAWELGNFRGQVHLILGNNPGDVWLLSKHCAKLPNVHLHGQFVFEELSGLRIAIVHFPELAEGLAFSKCFDLVCYGHTHVFEVRRVENTVLINPGELLGKEGPPTMAFFDSETKDVEKVIF